MEDGPPPILVDGDPPLRRPYDCKPRRARTGLRVFMDCAGDELLTVGAALPLPRSTESVTVPSELAHVFRTCQYARVPALEGAPDRFVAYEDPDVGRCYVLAPLARDVLSGLGRYDGGKHLPTLHPYIGAVVERALAEAAAAGFQFRVISGVRAGGSPSWHTFGLAVDINIVGRKGLKEATAAYLAGGEEQRAWFAIATAAERLGLFWLGRYDPGEIFHFEWRPGWGGLPHGELAASLVADHARGGAPAVWARLRHDAKRSTALEGLRDPTP